MEYSKQAHCVYYARYHLVFVTKYRRKWLKHGMGAYVQITLRAISRHHPDIVIHELNTDEDHIHLLISIPPRFSVSHIVNLLKSNSARAARRKFPFLKKFYDQDQEEFWSGGYFVSTVGANEDVIRKYIEHQGEEDKGQAKLVW
jgi:putative transposase